ncbi:MAG: Gfo/Idh/MocA family oxidoreductase [Victivallaceae bacterium]
MTLKFAFVGLRHGHIYSLLSRVKETAGCEIVAICEEDAATRQTLESTRPEVKVTHDNIDKMLAEVDCDVVATGDYYGKRGSILIRALKAGKHVIADKPVCTSLAELDQIEQLAKSNGLKVGCQLDLRQSPNIVTARNFIQHNCLGEIHAVNFGGQHPLLWGTRPGWYFEEGKHGGTINDIAIHGIDAIEWITGLKFTGVNSARTWNAFAKECPTFEDAGQFMLTMDNGCGALGDVSYFAPDSCGFTLPYYWEFTFWGTKGVLRTNLKDDSVAVTFNGDKGISRIAPTVKIQPDYFAQFIDDLNGKETEMNTDSVLGIARKTLQIQAVANQKLCAVKL